MLTASLSGFDPNRTLLRFWVRLPLLRPRWATIDKNQASLAAGLNEPEHATDRDVRPAATLYEIFDATIELQGPDFGDFFSSTTTGTLKIVPIAAWTRPSWITSQLSMLPQSTPLRSRL